MSVVLLRGQALLLLVVSILVGTVLASVVMMREGLPAPLAAKVADLVTPPESGLPASIHVGSSPSGATARPQPAVPVRAAASPTPSHAVPTSRPPGQVTVVTPPVYAYYDHGHDHGGGDDSSHH